MRELINKNDWMTRAGVAYVAAAVFLAGVPFTAFAAPAVDIKINGSNGPVTITEGETWNYSWTSSDAIACQITAPDGTGGTSLAGNGGPIDEDHPWYPAVGGSTTLTLDCTDGANSTSDSVTINVVAGGGGGSATPPTADIKANGQDGTITVTNGDSWSYSWTSSDATACQITAPDGVGGVSLAGNGGPISQGHIWYPAVGGSTTLTLNCTNGVDSVSDAVTVNIVAGGGGGGGTDDVTADIKINGQDSTVTITNGETWVYSWTSSDATACQITAPDGVGGVSLAGNGGPINQGHIWYPAVGGSTTLTLNCTNGVDSATDSATITVVAGGGGGGGDDDDISADIKINGQDGTVTITDGETWVYSWTSSDATACQITAPDGVGGVSLAGNGGPIDENHPWYPEIGETTTLTLDCTNGSDTATDSAAVRVVAPDQDGGGGGGGGGGGRSKSRNKATVDAVPVGNFCPYITQYMRMGQANDTVQVIRLQAFLQTMGGYNVTVNGVFDEATRQAVNAFQLKYASEILTPWGINQSTGYVYLLTAKKINEIVCGPQPSITVPQQKEIDTYVPPKEGVPEVGKEGKAGSKVGFGGTLEGVPVVGESSSGSDNGQNDRDWAIKDIGNGFAAALFAGPTNFSDFMQCLYEFVLILIVLYILGSVLENVLIKDRPENVRKKFFTKWGTISAGLLAALVGAYILGEWCLLLPLLITLVASVVWMFFYPKHDKIRSRAVAWQTSVSSRTKRLLEETKESIESDQKAVENSNR